MDKKNNLFGIKKRNPNKKLVYYIYFFIVYIIGNDYEITLDLIFSFSLEINDD